VAAAHTVGGLRFAARLKPTDVDIVEIRVDALLPHLGEVEKAMKAIKLPILLTVRHPGEGGLGALTTSQRRDLYLHFLPHASLLDLELRSLGTLPDVAAQAQAQGVILVASNHHFRSTPSLDRMLALQREAFEAGADVFKLAALAPTAATLARLLDFASRPAPSPHAVMGMGTFGQVSRLALGQAGSALNYGYLDEANAPGQWEARELKKLLQTLLPDAEDGKSKKKTTKGAKNTKA
jgi:3-dehydroquinate dehydratase I